MTKDRLMDSVSVGNGISSSEVVGQAKPITKMLLLIVYVRFEAISINYQWSMNSLRRSQS